METVTFKWSTQYGRCYDCGLPAAFARLGYDPVFSDENILRAVCAANAACDGENIARLDGE